MKKYHFAAGLFVATMAQALPAAAQNYPWCAHLDFGDAEGVNCGFVSNAQCLDTVRGVGGFCAPNYEYQGRPMASARHRRMPY